jgi:hypothetical protein
MLHMLVNILQSNKLSYPSQLYIDFDIRVFAVTKRDMDHLQALTTTLQPCNFMCVRKREMKN